MKGKLPNNMHQRHHQQINSNGPRMEIARTEIGRDPQRHCAQPSAAKRFLGIHRGIRVGVVRCLIASGDA